MITVWLHLTDNVQWCLNVEHVHTRVLSTVIPRIPSFLTDWSRYTKSSPMCGDSDHFPEEVVTVDGESPEWHRGLFLGCRTLSSSSTSDKASQICVRQQRVHFFYFHPRDELWNLKMITFDVIFNRYSKSTCTFICRTLEVNLHPNAAHNVLCTTFKNHQIVSKLCMHFI